MKAPIPITQALEHFLQAAWHRTAVLNQKMIGLAHSNLKFGFELARAKTLSDVLSLQADYWQKQFSAFQAEDVGHELSEAGEPQSAEAMKPQRAEAGEPRNAEEGEPQRAEAAEPRAAEADEPRSPDQEPVRQQTKAKTVESPVLVDAPEKPKQKSAQKPLRKAAAPDPHGERKSTKGRTKPAHGRPSSNVPRAPARKGRARGHDAVSPSATDKIQFGMLDGNAVRFTSTEAWALLDGAWRRVSADEVLTDAVVLSQARFDQLYPEVPQLPASAFRPKGKQNQ